MPSSLLYTTAISSLIVLSGCDQQKPDWTVQSDTKICIDRDGHRVASTSCATNPVMGGGYHGGGFFPYYLMRGAIMPTIGERVTGGSMSPRAGVSYAVPGAISRGGFGASAEAHGGFGAGE